MSKGCELLLISMGKVTCFGATYAIQSRGQNNGKMEYTYLFARLVKRNSRAIFLKMKHLALCKHLNATLVIVQYLT